MFIRTRSALASIGLLAACASATGQGVTVEAIAPLTVAPGDAVTVTVVAEAQPSALIEAIGGFALDFEVTFGDASVESIGSPVFVAMSEGTRVGPITSNAIEGIVGGQYADIDGSNPLLVTNNPATLFEV
ncbi:MAG: hypothetical protein AAFY46_09810, partial [Planctomycetota bacterium]